MFLVRSAFWLTVAFLTIHPQNVDVGAAATALSNQAVDAGKRVVVAQMLGTNCPALSCALPQGRTAQAPVTVPMPAPAVATTAKFTPSASPAPYPRPRPRWLG
jgi:hypothetical protein